MGGGTRGVGDEGCVERGDEGRVAYSRGDECVRVGRWAVRATWDSR
jgi:hypothetical protein